MKTSELIGPALDWAVAKCVGYADLRMNPHRYAAFLIMTPPRAEYGPMQLADLDFATNWELSGPIIEREEVEIGRYWNREPTHHMAWKARCGTQISHAFGPTPLIAAMRCFVSSRLGDEIEIPEELK